MRFYNTQHSYYCGIDLHARSMFTHILDHEGKTVFERDLPAGLDAFLDAVQPFRQGLVAGCECMFAWYWLADLCEDHELRQGPLDEGVEVGSRRGRLNRKILLRLSVRMHHDREQP